jgi:hypothetical protein
MIGFHSPIAPAMGFAANAAGAINTAAHAKPNRAFFFVTLNISFSSDGLFLNLISVRPELVEEL